MNSFQKLQITTSHDIKSLGTIVSFWAHPDDETFCSAGILATAAQNGQIVACVTATKGEAGVQDESRWPRDQLADIRAAELASALKILGVNNHHWLNYPDGGCAKVPQNEAIGRVAKLINKYQPDTILTFGPDGLTGHNDHVAVSGWVRDAVGALVKKPNVYYAVEVQWVYDKYLQDLDKKFNIYFNIFMPPIVNAKDCDIYFECDGERCGQKYRALMAMPSQYDDVLKVVDSDDFNKIYSVEAFVKAPTP